MSRKKGKRDGLSRKKREKARVKSYIDSISLID